MTTESQDLFFSTKMAVDLRIVDKEGALHFTKTMGHKMTYFFTGIKKRTVRWPTGAKHNSIPLSEHKNVFQNTRIFSRTQQSFLEHNDLFQNKIRFSETQQQTETQQKLVKHNKISKYW